MSLIAKEIMLKDFQTISEEHTAYEAIIKLLERKISILPVVNDEGFLLGIISETDLVYVDRKLNPSSYYAYEEANVPVSIRILNKDLSRLSTLQVKDIMTRKVVTVKETTPLEEIIHLIINEGIKTIPVVKDSKITGIITRKCILQYYIS
jgi:CBS domain-containing protein